MIKKIILLGVLTGLYFYSQAQWGRQNLDFRLLDEPFYIDSWIKQDITLGKVINYKSDSITLNDFKGKLIILVFWFPQCTDCIAQIPKEDFLQKKFTNDVQFIMVTFDREVSVKKFLEQYQSKTGISIQFPMIVEDTLLSRAFRHQYDPHYAWIFPDGYIVGQTNENFVTEDNISSLIKKWQERKIFFLHLMEEKKKALDAKN